MQPGYNPLSDQLKSGFPIFHADKNFALGQEKRLRCTCPVGLSESSVSLVPLLTLVVLWASWKELKEQAWFITCPEMCRGIVS